MAETKVCVSCLSTEMIFNIFDTHECEGNEEIYSEMLKFCFDITVSEESAAKYMCEKCILTLREAYIFKQDVLRNVKAFESDDTVEFIDVASIASSQDTATFGPVVFYMELDENEETPDKKSIKINEKMCIKKEIEYEDDVLKKSQKTESFKKPRNFVKVKTNGKISEPNSDGIFACETCPKQFTNKVALYRHSKTHLSGPFACGICDQVFSKLNSRNAHLWRVHNTSNPYICSVCGLRFTTLHRRLVHLQEVHNIKPEYKCSQCDKVFSDTSSRWQHVRSYHMRERKHKCTRKHCQLAFFKRRDLRNHMASVHGIGEKRHVCNICNKSFYLTNTYKQHLKRHFKMEDEIFKCLECQAEFTLEEEMKEHCKTHFKCTREITNENETEEGITNEYEIEEEIPNENDTEQSTVIVDHGEYSNDTMYFDVGESGLLINKVTYS